MFKKFIHSVIPAILLTLTVGSIYAFSIFVNPICAYTGFSPMQVQFAFSLGIFFLGMGAAFFGPLVERNIKKSTVLGTVLFIAGFLLTQCAVSLKSIWLLYLAYGAIVGTATGIIYISPVKTLMLWFKNNPGVASAVSIISFGFGASLCSLIYKKLIALDGVLVEKNVFLIFAAIYAAMMIVGSLLLKKPKGSEIAKKEKSGLNFFRMFWNDFYFRNCWLFMFLNISAGLAFIGVAAPMMTGVGVAETTAILVVALMGVSNTLGRFLFAWISDFVSDKNKFYIWLLIGALSIVVMVPAASFCKSVRMLIFALTTIPALYGAGFSTCPTVLRSHYGMDKISTIHGMVLSAWGVAGLCGPQISSLIFKLNGTYGKVPAIVGVLVVLVTLVTIRLCVKKEDENAVATACKYLILCQSEQVQESGDGGM